MTGSAGAAAPPGAPRRPGRPRDVAIDDAILDATVGELADRGFIGLSMEAIAARAGVAKTTLYRRWSTVDDLALAAMRRLQRSDPRAAADRSTAREQLVCLLDGLRRTLADADYAALMRRVSADGTSQPQIYRQFRDRLIAPHIEAMNQALRRAVREKIIRSDAELDWVRFMLVSPLLAATMTHHGRVTTAQLTFHLDTVLRGLAP